MTLLGIRRFLVIIAAGVAATGCLSDSSTSPGVGTIDPLAIDPAATSIMLDLPRGLNLRTGDATLALKVEGLFEEFFTLAVGGAGDAALDATPTRHVLVASIAAPDRKRYAAAQAKARAARIGGAVRYGSMSVSVTGGCTDRGVDLASDYATVSLRTGEKTVPLARFNLEDIGGKGALKALPRCTDLVPVTRHKDL